MESSRFLIRTLDHFYREVSDPGSSLLFGHMALIRAEGYGPDYPENYLPLDDTDYFSTHKIIYLRKKSENEVPVGCIKLVSLDRCLTYNKKLPLANTVDEGGTDEHKSALHQLIGSRLSQKKPLFYPSGLTVRKQYRKDGVGDQVKEIISALMHAQLLQYPDAQIVTAGVLKFKTPDFIRKIGFKDLTWNGRELPPFIKKSVGEEVVLLHLVETTEWAHACFEHYRDSFDESLTSPDPRIAA